MQYHRHAVAQMPQRIFPDIHAVHEHLPLVGVIQPRDQLHERTLPRSGRADDPDRLTWVRPERNMFQYIVLMFFIVAEPDIPEFDLPFFHETVLLGGLLIVQIHLRLQHFLDTLRGSERSRSLNHDHSDKHQRHQYLDDVSRKRREIADWHIPVHHLFPAEPDDGQRRHIHRQRHDRHHKDHDL